MQYLDLENILYLDLENALYFHQAQILMTFFLVCITECIKQGSSLQDKQDLTTQFLLTQKIKNIVSSNKNKST